MQFVWISILAFVSGCAGVLNKLLNLEAKKVLGMWNGTLLNYVESSILALLLSLVFGDALWKYDTLVQVPWWYFLGGIFGVVSMLLSLIGLQKTSMVYATIFMLVGQLLAGYFMDSIIGGEFEIIKLIGVLLIVLGVYIDKKVS